MTTHRRNTFCLLVMTGCVINLVGTLTDTQWVLIVGTALIGTVFVVAVLVRYLARAELTIQRIFREEIDGPRGGEPR